LLFTPRFILGQSFTLTFLAEWGDRSQYTTIALSASYNAFMICLGAILVRYKYKLRNNDYFRVMRFALV